MSNFNVNNPPGGPYSPSTIIGWLVQGVQAVWRRLNGVSTSSGGGGGSLTIGDPISGGASGRFLYENNANTLQETANFTYDGFRASTAAYFTATVAGLATTTDQGLTVQNTTAATVGVKRQYSPTFNLLGTNWNNGDSSSRIIGFRQYVSGTNVNTPNPSWNLDYTTDGTTYTNVIAAITGSSCTITSTSTTITGTLTLLGGTITVGTTGINMATGKTLTIDIGNADSTAGTATLVAGTVTVATTAVLTGDIIMLSVNTPGGTTGINYSAPTSSIVNATSFVINSVSAAGAVVITDTSTINWFIIHTQ